MSDTEKPTVLLEQSVRNKHLRTNSVDVRTLDTSNYGWAGHVLQLQENGRMEWVSVEKLLKKFCKEKGWL